MGLIVYTMIFSWDRVSFHVKYTNRSHQNLYAAAAPESVHFVDAEGVSMTGYASAFQTSPEIRTALEDAIASTVTIGAPIGVSSAVANSTQPASG